jgi:biotin carboxylase
VLLKATAGGGGAARGAAPTGELERLVEASMRPRRSPTGLYLEKALVGARHIGSDPGR